jgi:hypothetical protein
MKRPNKGKKMGLNDPGRGLPPKKGGRDRHKIPSNHKKMK